MSNEPQTSSNLPNEDFLMFSAMGLAEFDEECWEAFSERQRENGSFDDRPDFREDAFETIKAFRVRLQQSLEDGTSGALVQSIASWDSESDKDKGTIISGTKGLLLMIDHLFSEESSEVFPAEGCRILFGLMRLPPTCSFKFPVNMYLVRRALSMIEPLIKVKISKDEEEEEKITLSSTRSLGDAVIQSIKLYLANISWEALAELSSRAAISLMMHRLCEVLQNPIDATAGLGATTSLREFIFRCDFLRNGIVLETNSTLRVKREFEQSPETPEIDQTTQNGYVDVSDPESNCIVKMNPFLAGVHIVLPHLLPVITMNTVGRHRGTTAQTVSKDVSNARKAVTAFLANICHCFPELLYETQVIVEKRKTPDFVAPKKTPRKQKKSKKGADDAESGDEEINEALEESELSQKMDEDPDLLRWTLGDPLLAFFTRAVLEVPDKKEWRELLGESVATFVDQVSSSTVDKENLLNSSCLDTPAYRIAVRVIELVFGPEVAEKVIHPGSMDFSLRFVAFLCFALKCDRTVWRSVAIDVASRVLSSSSLQIDLAFFEEGTEGNENAASVTLSNLLPAALLLCLLSRYQDPQPTVRIRSLEAIGNFLENLGDSTDESTKNLLKKILSEESSAIYINSRKIIANGLAEDRIMVRRAVVGFVEGLVTATLSLYGDAIPSLERNFENLGIIEALDSHMMDVGVQIRMKALALIEHLLEQAPSSKIVYILWKRHMLPSVTDVEECVVLKAKEYLELSIFKPLISMHFESTAGFLSLLTSDDIEYLQRSTDIYLKTSEK
eukprot:GHVP01026976.1.p1 GENE.GHVP01026976.1~~GHVP01026976.1.p1  ORF type:complete len:787 (-),score=177.91 GHVP01026976.1:2297-4657(-)